MTSLQNFWAHAGEIASNLLSGKKVSGDGVVDVFQCLGPRFTQCSRGTQVSKDELLAHNVEISMR